MSKTMLKDAGMLNLWMNLVMTRTSHPDTKTADDALKYADDVLAGLDDRLVSNIQVATPGGFPGGAGGMPQ